MTVVRNEHVILVDVDGTLLRDFPSDVPLPDGGISITCPHLGDNIIVHPNENNVRLVREKKARGGYVVVWSQGGFAWAEAVVQALGLSDSVDQIMSKPAVLIDDLPAERWMPKPTHIPHDQHWKRA